MLVHTYTNTHTTECTKAAKATTPSARCIPGWKVSPCGLSPICVTVGVRPASHPAVSSQEPTQVTLHQPEHNHLPCCISIQLSHTCSFNCYGLLEGIIMEIKKKRNNPHLLSLCTQP